MTNTSGSRRISSAMASRSASRIVMVTISVPSGTSGSGAAALAGASTVPVFGGAGGCATAGLLAAGDVDDSLLLTRRRGCGGLCGLAVLKRRGILAFAEDHRDRRVDRNIIGAFRHQDLAERAFVDRLDFHGGLVGFDLGDHVAGFNGVAFLLQPFGEVALLHRRRQSGHQDRGWHGGNSSIVMPGRECAPACDFWGT